MAIRKKIKKKERKDRYKEKKILWHTEVIEHAIKSLNRSDGCKKKKKYSTQAAGNMELMSIGE